MKFIIKTHKNTDDEIAMGHKLGFATLRDVDAISLSANDNGFTTLTAALRSLRLPSDYLREQVSNCQGGNNVVYAGTVLDPWYNKKHILLVPATRGATSKKNSYEHYMVELIRLCNFKGIKCLHFGHYSFVNSGFQHSEVHRILSVLLNPLIYTTLDKVYFEVDARCLKDLLQVYKYVNDAIYKNGGKDPEIIVSPEFEYVVVQTNPDGSTWREFVAKQEDLSESQIASRIRRLRRMNSQFN